MQLWKFNLSSSSACNAFNILFGKFGSLHLSGLCTAATTSNLSSVVFLAIASASENTLGLLSNRTANCVLTKELVTIENTASKILY